MYTSNDFERLFIRYKAESVPAGESLQTFCIRNGVPYNLFHKWYKDTRHQLIPVRLDGVPQELPASSGAEVPSASADPVDSLRILLDIRMSNGIHIQQRNLSYAGLKRLVENLEALC